MGIFAIADLHLSFGTNKPMNIFGENWDGYEEKLKQDWTSKVTEDDFVLLLGDFSWSLNLKDTYNDFKYINDLPGKKILLKGNHDFWWTTVTGMRKYLTEQGFSNIDFLHNNSYFINEHIIVGTRGWVNTGAPDDNKIQKREMVRLRLSVEDGINKYGEDKPIILCTHYPPYSCKQKDNIVEALENYDIVTWLYGHLHGKAHQDIINNSLGRIKCQLISSDYLGFRLVKIV